MKPITLSDVKNIYEYEKIRSDIRAKIMDGKKSRRFHIGENMTIVFENRNSVLFQIHEMIRTEKIITDEGMQHEIDTYNQLLPADGELSATLLIDITEPHLIKPMLDSLVGLNRERLFLGIGSDEYAARFDEEQAEDDRISAVQYLKWHLSQDDIRRFADPKTEVSLLVRHPNYNARHVLTEQQRSALLSDLRESTPEVFT